MSVRSMAALLVSAVAVTGGVAGVARAAEKHISSSTNLSALGLTADDTELVWDGSYTLTVDATNTFKISGINADGNNAVIAFSGTNKLRLANTTGNIVIQEGFGGDISVTGANSGAGFSTTLETGAVVEVQATINDADAANNWLIGNNTLLLSGSAPQVGTVQIGSDGGVAKIDVDQNATIATVTPSGDFTIDIASGKTLTVTNAFSVGDNTLTLMGAGATSLLTAAGGLNLNNANARLLVTGSATLSNLDVSASGIVELGDGVALTLTDAIPIGANTLTVRGTTGASAETITATGGFTLDNASSTLKVDGDAADALVISKVDITGADLTAGNGIDADQSVQITALTVSQNATLDVASGKTLSGTTTLNAAKTLTLNNTGTVSSVTTSTAAGTVQMTAQGTITTLTNNIAGTTIDIDESATITTMTVSENAMIDVASGKTLTTAATVAAGKILTTRQAGTVSNVVLNGAAAELNVTSAAGIITTLNVNVDGGVLDADNACTVTSCVMAPAAGNLTVENANVRITSTGGFDVNDNTLQITQAGGTIDLVTLDTGGGNVDVDESTTITAMAVSADATLDVAASKTLTTTATVSAGDTLTRSGTGTVSTVALNGSSAELNMTAAGTVSTVNVTADGGVIDVDESCTLSSVNLTGGAGDTTLDVVSGKTLSSTIDVNNNTLTIANTGTPGSIRFDTDGGVLDVDADCTVSSLTITSDVAIDVASNKTLTGTANISTYTLTLPGSGTISRVDASTGSILANGSGTISDLRVSFGSGGVFTYGGTGASTVTTLSNSSVGANETFRKTGTGTLTLEGGFTSIFSKATGVVLDIDGGEVVLGEPGSSDDVTFNDDGDEITLASGATLTTYGSFTVSSAGDNVNLDVPEGATLNLRSSGGSETLTAAADDDFSLLGTVHIDGTNGDYSLQGAHVFRFGDVTINSTGSLINNTPSSTMSFLPGAVVDLTGAGATLTIDGQSGDTPIVLGTTTGTGAFTIDRGSSSNMTVKNARISNATYTSDSGGAAIDELTLTAVTDDGGNTNWFVPAEVIDDGGDAGDSGGEAPPEDGAGGDETPVQEETGGGTTPPISTGPVATVDEAGEAVAGASSATTGASALVEVSGATSGSLFVTVADGNLRDDFAGIPGQDALPVTVQVFGSVTGDFSAVVELCYAQQMLTDAGLSESDLVLYVYDEPDGRWVLAGADGHYQGNASPTDRVGDYGIDTAGRCVWAVRDGFSVFAAGAGSTDSSAVGSDGGTGSADTTSNEPASPAPPPLCGIFGLVYLVATILGLTGLKRYAVHPAR